MNKYPFAFCLPLSSPRLLYRRVEARKLEVKFLETVTVEGPIMKEIENLGFTMIDGLTHIIAQNQGMLLVIGTVTRNGRFR